MGDKFAYHIKKKIITYYITLGDIKLETCLPL